jgi:hypothetical protein
MTLFDASRWPLPAPSRLVNGTLFNIAWLAIILSQSSMVAMTVVLVFLWLHARWVRLQRGEAVLIAGVTLCGAVLDQVLFYTGVFNLAGKAALAPLWLTCVWPVFATTLMHAFAGMERKVWLAVVVGAAGGMMSYGAGVRLTAVAYGSAVWGPVTLGLLWALIFPSLLLLAARMRGPVDTLQAWYPAVGRGAPD